MSQFGPDYVRAIAPYQAGKPISEVAREFGLDEANIVKLASNENPLGMPESARLAMQKAVADIGRYPDANGFDLKAAITAKYDVPSEWITLGNGSNDILELATHAFVQAGQAAMYAEYSFVVYALATQAVGARAIVVKAKDYGHDLGAMAAAITDDTKLPEDYVAGRVQVALEEEQLAGLQMLAADAARIDTQVGVQAIFG